MDECQQNLYCMKDARQKGVHTIWFHLCRILENENQFVVKGSRSVVAWEWGMEVDGLQRQHKELLREMNIFIILIVVMVSQLHSYVQAHQIVHI